MSWSRIRACYTELVRARDSGISFADSWAAFADAVAASRDAPPYHLRGILGALRETCGQDARADIRILDHGCGGAVTLLYLLALGYRGIHGVDVGGNCQTWNRLLQERFGISERRFSVYDGRRLPLPNDSIDFLFSEEVLEHVHPTMVEDYYAEEARVLKPGAAAYHQVPHRWVPYESHTRTWVLHYLPRVLSLPLYRLLGRNAEFVRQHLFLRRPGFHYAMFRRHIGEYTDRTSDRLAGLTQFDYYDGPVRLRRLVARLVGIPGLGRALVLVFRHLVMIQTLSRKTPLQVSASK